jgi:hypothetical protein
MYYDGLIYITSAIDFVTYIDIYLVPPFGVITLAWLAWLAAMKISFIFFSWQRAMRPPSHDAERRHPINSKEDVMYYDGLIHITSVIKK